MARITVVGAGMMGSAMARPAVDNGHEVRLAGTPLDGAIIASLREKNFHPTLRRTFPETVSAWPVEELDAALEGADWIIGGVSSFGVDWFADEVLPRLPAGAKVLSVTKGLRNAPGGKLVPFPHWLKEKRPDVFFNAVGGPCICFELFDRRPTMVYFCGDDARVVEEARALLATAYYHPQPSTDVRGVEGCVALKNAYALGVSLAVGIADREVAGDADVSALCQPGAPDRNPLFNPQAALFGQSCREMRLLVERLGGDGALAGDLPGAGDLYVTIFGGRTRRLGTLLGRGLPFKEAVERLGGVTLESVAIVTAAARALREGGADLTQFPLLMHLDAVINKGQSADLPWTSFSPATMGSWRGGKEQSRTASQV